MRTPRLAPSLPAAAAAALLACAACASDEPVDVPPLPDYTGWHRIATTGPAPGHGDTIRIIYVNDVARTFAGGSYPEGSIAVKEIYERTASGDRGALSYLAIMRRIGPAPAAGEDQAGWVFTEADAPGADERGNERCWRTCHAAAPYAGAFFDYSRASSR